MGENLSLSEVPVEVFLMFMLGMVVLTVSMSFLHLVVLLEYFSDV